MANNNSKQNGKPRAHWGRKSFSRKRFGERIKEARELSKFTQAQLGELVGYSEGSSAISNIERGNAGMTTDSLFKLCQKLRVAPGYLFDLEG